MKTTTILAHDGIEQPITEWALDYGITPAIIIERIRRGVSIADAITTPMTVSHVRQQLPVFHKQQVDRPTRKQPKRRGFKVQYVHNGEALTIAEWAKRTGLKDHTIRSRLKSDWSIEAALTTPLKLQPSPPLGVVSNFAPSEGTGAGSTAQETPKITFSEKA